MKTDYRRWFRFLCGLIVCSLFIANPSPHAYVLQGLHILELMIEKNGQAQSLSISQKMMIFDIKSQEEGSQTTDQGMRIENKDDRQTESEASNSSGRHQDVYFLDENLKYVFSQAFRSDTRSEKMERIHVVSNGETLTVVDGAVSKTESRFDLYKDLLLYRSRKTLSERLFDLGVDVTVSSLGRYEGQLAYVVGAVYPDESVPQIWFDKESFRPFRWIITSRDNGNGLEVRYLQWRPLGSLWYPMRIEFLQGENMVRVIKVENYELDPFFPEDQFDIARLKSLYPRAATVSIKRDDSEGISEVQKTINEFERLFE